MDTPLRPLHDLWFSDWFTGLSPLAKTISLYLLTGPHTNVIGCFRLPLGYIAEDLGMPEQRAEVIGAVEEVLATSLAFYDPATKMMLVPSILKTTPLSSDTVAEAARLMTKVPDVLRRRIRGEYEQQLARLRSQPGPHPSPLGDLAPADQTEAPVPSAPAATPPAKTRSNTYHERTAAEDEFVKAWNELAEDTGIPKIVRFTAHRSRTFAARRHDPFFVANWQAGLERIKKIPGLWGSNDRGWKGDVDWFLRPDTLVKIMEGKYDSWDEAKTALPKSRDPLPDLQREAEAAKKIAQQREAEAAARQALPAIPLPEPPEEPVWEPLPPSHFQGEPVTVPAEDDGIPF